MSLRTTYTGSLDSKLAQARQAGYDAIMVTNLAFITTELTNAANKGLTEFDVTYTVSYQPNDIRLKGNLYDAYRTGILQAFASQDIMNQEVSVELDTSDSVITLVVLSFSF